MKNIKLSICIPTYNRSKYLRELLDSIILAIENSKEKSVEILVSDNHSKDDTYTLVERYSSMYSFIKYIRPINKLAPELNFRFVASKSLGDYVWVIGDDDSIEEFSLGYIFKLISSNCSLLILNFSVYDRDMKNLIKKSFYNYHYDISFDNCTQVLENFGISLGYISGLIFNRNLLFKLPLEQYEKYIEYGFSFAYAIYYGLVGERNITYCSKTLFRNRSGNSGNYDYYKYFAKGSYLIFNELKKIGYSNISVKKANRLTFKTYLAKRILLDKRDGFWQPESSVILQEIYSDDYLYYTIVLIFINTPAALVKLIWFFYKIIKR